MTQEAKTAPMPQREIETSSHIPVKPLYTPADLKRFDYENEIGYPGEYPFTRGIHPTQYRSRLWTMRQYAGYGTAAESNARYRYLLERGQTGAEGLLVADLGLRELEELEPGEVDPRLADGLRAGAIVDPALDLNR